ncbi:MAG: GEVED domain-containing protein [Chloroflexota bacterium]
MSAQAIVAQESYELVPPSQLDSRAKLANSTSSNSNATAPEGTEWATTIGWSNDAQSVDFSINGTFTAHGWCIEYNDDIPNAGDNYDIASTNTIHTATVVDQIQRILDALNDPAFPNAGFTTDEIYQTIALAIWEVADGIPFSNSNGNVGYILNNVSNGTYQPQDVIWLQSETETTQNFVVPLALTDAPTEFDYGDLPDHTGGVSDNYPTDVNDQGEGAGAAHWLDGLTYLGSCVDAEADGLPDADAGTNSGGDDNSSGGTTYGSCSGGDDEDGVTFNTGIPGNSSAEVCSTITIDVMDSGAGSGGVLHAWADWNADGDFDDTISGESELIANGVSISDGGTIQLSVDIPCDNSVVGNDAYIRFRYTAAGANEYADQVASPISTANTGEVEDYAIALIAQAVSDWGDLPDASVGGIDYPTDSTNNGGEGVGASHTLSNTTYLGSCVDAESDGIPDLDAGTISGGDDDDSGGTTFGSCTGSDDEDGVSFDATTNTNGGIAVCSQFTASVTDSGAGSGGVLNAWVDWNADGTFDDTISGVSEQIAANLSIGDGATSNITVNVPCNNSIVGNDAFLRFRYTTSTGEGGQNPTGPATSGEVEDYMLPIYGWDFGDAPDSSTQTTISGSTGHLNAGSGARHLQNDDLSLGSCTDAETNGSAATSPAAPNGDDSNDSSVYTGSGGSCSNDEDGFSGTQPDDDWSDGNGSIQASVTGVSSTSCLYGWIDWDNDGFSNDGSSDSFTSQSVSSDGNVTLNFSSGVPSGLPSNAYLRLRLVPGSCQGSFNPFGPVVGGEVEDHQMSIAMISFDWGDLPDASVGSVDYPTNSTDAGGEGVGASHRLTNTTYLGSCVDAETDGIPDLDAGTADGGDDDDSGGTTFGSCSGNDDEDGVTYDATTTTNGGLAICSQFTVNVADSGAGSGGVLNAWIDWNADGTFDDTIGGVSEQIATNQSIGDGATANITINVPCTNSIVGNDAFMRFRYTTSTGEGGQNPTGAATSGEVEDYVLPIYGWDFGDMPDLNDDTLAPTSQTSYLSESGEGARHLQTDNLRLGSCTDAELTGAPDTQAGMTGSGGDDTSQSGVITGGNASCSTSDDEDGIDNPSSDIDHTWGIDNEGTVIVSVNGVPGDGACVYGYIDWDADGFGTDDGNANNGNLSTATTFTNTNGDVTLTFNSGLPTSGSYPSDPVYLRIRVVPDPLCNPLAANGPATGGEIEDYRIFFTPTALNLQSITASTTLPANPFLVGAAVLLVLLCLTLELRRRYR